MYAARIKLPADLSETDVEKLSEAMAGIARAHSALRENNISTDPWYLEWIIENKMDKDDIVVRMELQRESVGLAPFDIQDCAIEKIPDINWLEHSYQQFKPFSVGVFFIYGSHYEGEVPAGQRGLHIDAATAFGSGEHGTTKGCLLAMQELKDMGACPWNVLDMGTGSGILAIAAWKLWKTPVLAIDVDKEAINVCQRHCKTNKITSDVLCEQDDGFKARGVQERKPFDLIIANILSGTLKEMATDLTSVADENGYAILSGILTEQKQGVLNVYEAAGWVLKKEYELEDWSTLLLHNPPA